MANPYPMNPQPQMPMMQPPMGTGQGPVPAMTQQRPAVMKRGTSKAVPVVVSAGLAIGVFCGLLFGLGVDKDEAIAATVTTAETPKKADGDVASPFQPDKPKDTKVPSLAPQEVKEIKKDGTTVPKDPKDTKVGTGSDAKPEAGKPAEPPKPTKVNGTLKIEILPEDAAKAAKVEIDGKEVSGASYELDMTEAVTAATKDLKPDAKKPEVKKELKYVVKASGFRDYTGKIEIIAERDTTLKVTMQKKSSGSTGSGLPRPPPGGYVRPPPPNNGGGQKCKKPPCGLIDI